MIAVENKRRKPDNILKDYADAEIIDVTSKGNSPYVKFSPFYPIGNLPVPFSENVVAASVEGIWQGLKVFETEDVDVSKFQITNMKGLKRTVRKFGKPKGHRVGVNGIELLDYITARHKIYVPTYNWVLENKLQKELELLAEIAKKKTLVLLDYETNEDVNNPAKPLSHASLVKKKLESMR
ncbi:DUF6939 family protein [Chondrinema litorale]|uniref:DUF6939 family protein n=1 Tax=Chondrinema litorale TaxID=2994555 RepID=UPI002543CB71|nr:hypothetical protein [Chondrinema litorale]UZR92270.1 hypothetical protein OQ292_10375 [Chondrinema litorale]